MKMLLCKFLSTFLFTFSFHVFFLKYFMHAIRTESMRKFYIVKYKLFQFRPLKVELGKLNIKVKVSKQLSVSSHF